MEEITLTWAWWVTVFDVPALGALLWLVLRTRASLFAALDKVKTDLAAYKLAVADKYATTAHLHEVETRIAGELATMNKTLSGLARDINRMQGAREGGRAS